jgi:glutamyl-Q tRNA(Asp) synthetase
LAERPNRHIVGRFAPSPTGALHTGSLVTAVGSYLMAKQAGGTWLLRLDDLDAQRQVPGMQDDIKRTLELFGLLWDGEATCQSRHTEEYQRYFSQLLHTGAAYPCCCSRAEIARSASAPHSGEECVIYSGECRDGMGNSSGGTPAIRSWRIRVPEEEICFSDLRKGRICQKLPDISGDFVIKRGDGEVAYQLAVVVDDQVTGVTQVTRGDDLLSSTPRQILLQRLLGFRTPEYCHLPLVTGPNNSKLSKRDHLVSHQLRSITGRESTLLCAVLRFLGQNPPRELSEYPCHEILCWGVANFRSLALPHRGGPLEI